MQRIVPCADRAGKEEHLTDLGNARRLVSAFGDDLLYCPARRSWLVWTGKRWKPDSTLRVMRRAKATIREMYEEVASITDDGKRLNLLDHARHSESEARLRAMVTLARSEPGIPVTPDALDLDPWLLNVLNGTIDLRTGKLRPHRRKDLITKLVSIEYDPDAKCARWEAFLDRIFAGDQGLIGSVQRAAGYSLTSTARERVIFLLFGSGANGKTTFLETLRAVLGDYAMTTPIETLLVKRTGGIPNDLARLKGARLVTTSEADKGARLAEALVKQLTGRDTIAARFLYGEFFDFRPTFTLWLATNHKPIIRGNEPAIWDRIRLIPFMVRIPAGQQDKTLLEKLRRELPGILRWLVDGCLAWERKGLGVAPAVKQATGLYEIEMDALSPFLEACCIINDAARATFEDLWAAYQNWARRAGKPSPLSSAEFGERLTDRGFAPGKGTKGIRIRRGIGLRKGRVAQVARGGGKFRKSSNEDRL
jgi:putative DNA primase/helicase